MKKCKEKCKKEMFPTVIAEAFIRPLGLCFWDVSKVGFRWRCSHQLRPSWVDSTNTSRMPKRVGGAIGNFCSKRALKKYLGEKAREHEFLLEMRELPGLSIFVAMILNAETDWYTMIHADESCNICIYAGLSSTIACDYPLLLTFSLGPVGWLFMKKDSATAKASKCVFWPGLALGTSHRKQ